MIRLPAPRTAQGRKDRTPNDGRGDGDTELPQQDANPHRLTPKQPSRRGKLQHAVPPTHPGALTTGRTWWVGAGPRGLRQPSGTPPALSSAWSPGKGGWTVCGKHRARRTARAQPEASSRAALSIGHLGPGVVIPAAYVAGMPVTSHRTSHSILWASLSPSVNDRMGPAQSFSNKLKSHAAV